jgi:hypothetical protein
MTYSRVRAPPSPPGHHAWVCQLCGAAAVAARGLWPGGALSHPPRPCPLPPPGQAHTAPPQPGQKNLAAAGDFVPQCPRHLGPIATLGRQTPTQPVRVVCHDESWRGLHLPGRWRLTGDGVKPVQVVEPRYAYYGLSAAVEPTTGEAFWWELPRLDAASCTVPAEVVAITERQTDRHPHRACR